MQKILLGQDLSDYCDARQPSSWTYVKQDGFGIDQLAGARKHASHTTGSPGADRVLHLHAFDNREHVTFCDRVAALDAKLNDATRERRGGMRVRILGAPLIRPGGSERDLGRALADDLQALTVSDQFEFPRSISRVDRESIPTQAP